MELAGTYRLRDTALEEIAPWRTRSVPGGGILSTRQIAERVAYLKTPRASAKRAMEP
jgi:hypothetical protein